VHVVSVNPEILILSRTNEKFRKVIETAQIQLVDGVGISYALSLLFNHHTDRLTGTTLMQILLDQAGKDRLRVLLIGGRPKIAAEIAECYSQTYSNSNYLGITGIDSIKKPQREEEEQIFSIVASLKPHIVFVSFGSPDQELWIDRHQKQFSGCVCIGVGGAFDFISGSVIRAPDMIQKIGLEWLYRLLAQPWRIWRQLRLVKFVGLVLAQKLSG